MGATGDREEIVAAIAALEQRRALLGDAVVEPAIAALRDRLARLPTSSLSVAGERRLVTVMFADTSGFTALSETHDAEYVRNLMNDCFEVLVPEIERFGGTVDKFIGDAVMALFGAPQAREDDADRALSAALAMMDALAEFNRKRGSQVGLHFGINTGEVIAGDIGSAGRREYSVIGDAVNVAARLEDLSKTGEIFVGPETERLCRDRFLLEEVAETRLKGRDEPVRVFRLCGLRRSGAEAGWAASRAMVGRETEFAAIMSAIERLADGTHGVLLIQGDAGVGKSRLVTEARALAGDRVAWLQGQAVSQEQNTSYAVERSIILKMLGATLEVAPHEVAEALLASCRALLQGGAERVYAHLAILAGLPEDEVSRRYTRSVVGSALKPRLAQAFLRYARAWAGSRPLVLCLEDVHWLDSASVELIREHLLPHRTPGLLLLITVRSDALRDLGLLSGAAHERQVIRIEPLDAAACRQLIENFPDGTVLPADQIQLAIERAEGNPFFLEELLRVLIDSGPSSVENRKVPTTLKGIITARMDRLPSASRATLQTASVIGRQFPERLLSFVQRGEETGEIDIADRLKQLERREFVRQKLLDRLDERELEYMFSHAITQEVVYGTLLLKRREQIHLAIAKTIEIYFGDRSDEFAAALAFHFERAGMRARSAFYHLAAAQRAARIFAHGEAMVGFRAALDQLGGIDPSERTAEDRLRMVACHLGLGDVLELDGDHEGAQAQYETALDLCELGEGILRSKAQRKFGLTLMAQRASSEALEQYDRAVAALGSGALASSGEWWSEWIEVQLERMWAIYWLGDAQLLSTVTEALRPAVETHGTVEQRSRFLKRSILIDFRNENLNISDATLARSYQAMELSQQCGDPDDLARAHFMVGYCHMLRGDTPGALPDLAESLRLTRHTGTLEYRVMALVYTGVAHRRANDLAETRRWADESLAESAKAKMPIYTAVSRANLAWLARRSGDPEAAEAIAGEVQAMWQNHPFQSKWLAAWPLLACRAARKAFEEVSVPVVAMLAPDQYRQPDALDVGLRSLKAALDEGDFELCGHLTDQLIPIAERHGFA